MANAWTPNKPAASRSTTGSGTVTTERRTDGQPAAPPETKNELFAAPAYDGVPAKVRFGCGLTLALGDFEMARIDVSLEMPCDPAKTGEMFERCQKWATDRLKAEVQKVRAAKKQVF